MVTLFRILYALQEGCRKAMHRLFREPVIRASFCTCGRKVHIAENCDFKGIGNISVGSDSVIGCGSVLWTTRAKISIDDKVLIGPNVTIITGDHRMDLVGRYMADISDDEKKGSEDADVVIRKDVWIGANAVILKGVTIETGCVIAAGAVVTKSTQPYGIYAGVPAVRIRERFSEEAQKEHIRQLACSGN